VTDTEQEDTVPRNPPNGEPGADQESPGTPGARVPTVAGALVLLLALAALFWPSNGKQPGQGVLLVFDPLVARADSDQLYGGLAAELAVAAGRPLELVVTRHEAEFWTQIAEGAVFILCPDGMALALERTRFAPLVAGRRAMPRNLRPRGVLVYRKSAGMISRPWEERPNATILGDSLSLTAIGAVDIKDTADSGEAFASWATALPECGWGIDPYDHSAVLHAVRLGCFDYAVVRQWDADRFLAGGLLNPVEWGVEALTGPVPDIVLFASRDLSRTRRLECGDILTRLGRSGAGSSSRGSETAAALDRLHLTGFRLLLEPDLELLRKGYPRYWPRRVD